MARTKILKKDLRNGRVSLRVETLDDVWHVKHLVDEGDLVEALTARRDESQTDKLRQERGEKRKVVLGVRAEKVEFHDFSDRLRISGVIETGSMGKGSHHTLNVETGDRVTIIKERWLKHQLDRMKEAVKATGRPVVLILSLEEGNAVLGALRHFGVQKIAEIAGGKEAKQYATKSDVKSFMKEVLDEVTARREANTPLIIVGPGFTKEGFLRFALDAGADAVKGASVVGTGQAGMTGIYEALKTGAVSKAAEATRVEEETLAVERLLEGIGKDGAATYGPGHVAGAVDRGAVELLLVTDEKVRDDDTSALMERCEGAGGRCLIVSTAHDGGKKLQALGGLGALLRYKTQAVS